MRGCSGSSFGQGNAPSARYDAAMTPAINLLKREKIAHTVRSYVHDAHAGSYGGEAVDKLGLDPARCSRPCWPAPKRTNCWWRSYRWPASST